MVKLDFKNCCLTFLPELLHEFLGNIRLEGAFERQKLKYVELVAEAKQQG